VLALAGFGITALSLAPLAAISSLAPDAARLPRRLLTEPVPLPTLSRQALALAEQELRNAEAQPLSSQGLLTFAAHRDQAFEGPALAASLAAPPDTVASAR